MIFAIDPGPERSGWVQWGRQFDGMMPLGVGLIDSGADWENEDVLALARVASHRDTILVEEVLPFECAGRPIVHSIRFTGRLEEIAHSARATFHVLPYHKVRVHLTGNPRAKESAVRAAVLERFGGSDKLAKGTKKEPGPLYGISGHAWSALALALAHIDLAGVDQGGL